jgi:hypothetical protein
MRTGQLEQLVGDPLYLAGHLEHLAEHRTQTDDRRDMGEDLADPAFHVRNDPGWWYSGGYRDTSADHQQGHETPLPPD